LHGIDLNPTMVEIANQKASVFEQGDVRSFRAQTSPVDLVVSLFHVINYQNTNEDLLAMLQTARSLLKSGGIFLFDCWYGPAVLESPPHLREKNFENADFLVRRVARPEFVPDEQRVVVHYTFQISEKQSREKFEFQESHSMRYLFLPEIESFANKTGFSVLCAEEWLSGQELTPNSWNATVVLRAGE